MTTPKPKPLGDRIRDLREATTVEVVREGPMTQSTLAERAGISQAFLHQIEAGIKQPSLATLRALAEALGVPVGELVD